MNSMWNGDLADRELFVTVVGQSILVALRSFSPIQQQNSKMCAAN